MINPRQYRKELKQKLFTIRRFEAGEEGIRLNSELKDLKKHYESLPNFTKWDDFPERWDIGDPYGVKADYIQSQDNSLNDADRRNYAKLQDKLHEEIVSLEFKEEELPEEVEEIEGD